MELFLQTVFWISAGLILYSYAGYPLLLKVALWRQAVATPGLDREWSDEASPRVTVLITAYNAARHLEERINNLLESDYPGQNLEIVVASDGSSDATVAVVRQFGHPRVRALDYSQRRGKAATLVAAANEIQTDVLVLTDASTSFERDTIRQLARHFLDPEVGVVTGWLTMSGDDGTSAEGVYWRLESNVRRDEARLGLLTGASGAVYAIRRSCLVAPHNPIINDDLVLPILCQLTHGCRFVLEPLARAKVRLSTGVVPDFRRRVRIGLGAYQALVALRSFFGPRHLRWAIAFTSHKVLRWWGPFFLLAICGANLGLLTIPFYRATLWAQVAFYLTAAIGLRLPGDHRANAHHPRGKFVLPDEPRPVRRFFPLDAGTSHDDLGTDLATRYPCRSRADGVANSPRITRESEPSAPGSLLALRFVTKVRRCMGGPRRRAGSLLPGVEPRHSPELIG